MAKEIIIPKNITIVAENPFRMIGSNENTVNFVDGSIFSNGSELTISETKPLKDSEEYFLNIKYEPLSTKIKSLKILSQEDFLEQREKEDDLLNACIPLAREISPKNFLNTNAINGKPFFFRKGNEIRMSGFFLEGKVYLSGFAVFSPSGELIVVFKNLEINAKEGDSICLIFDGKIRYIPNKKNEFYISNISVESRSPENANVTSKSFFTKSSEDEKGVDLECSFSFPIGVISKGNYVAMGRGNAKINVLTTAITYFDSEKTLDSGRKESVFETNHNYFLYPSFV